MIIITSNTISVSFLITLRCIYSLLLSPSLLFSSPLLFHVGRFCCWFDSWSSYGPNDKGMERRREEKETTIRNRYIEELSEKILDDEVT